MDILARLIRCAQRCGETTREFAAVCARRVSFTQSGLTAASGGTGSHSEAQEVDAAQSWTSSPVRIHREASGIDWHVPMGGYRVVDVQLQRFPKSLSIDLVVEDGKVLQRVLPVPEMMSSQPADQLPDCSVGSDEVLIHWPGPRSGNRSVAPLPSGPGEKKPLDTSPLSSAS